MQFMGTATTKASKRQNPVINPGELWLFDWESFGTTDTIRAEARIVDL
jgi:hypothetical protein